MIDSSILIDEDIKVTIGFIPKFLKNFDRICCAKERKKFLEKEKKRKLIKVNKKVIQNSENGLKTFHTVQTFKEEYTKFPSSREK